MKIAKGIKNTRNGEGKSSRLFWPLQAKLIQGFATHVEVKSINYDSTKREGGWKYIVQDSYGVSGIAYYLKINCHTLVKMHTPKHRAANGEKTKQNQFIQKPAEKNTNKQKRTKMRQI